MDPQDAWPDRPSVADPGARPTDGCRRRLGYFDGFMAGSHSIAPNGHRYYLDPALLNDPDYKLGAEAGRAHRVDRDRQP